MDFQDFDHFELIFGDHISSYKFLYQNLSDTTLRGHMKMNRMEYRSVMALPNPKINLQVGPANLKIRDSGSIHSNEKPYVNSMQSGNFTTLS